MDKSKQPTKQCFRDGYGEGSLIALGIIRPTQNSRCIKVKINQLFLNSLKYKIYLRELGGNCWDKYRASRQLGPIRNVGPL
jgi:hypothetical protein